MKRILVDMMGGDRTPEETVKGVCLAAEEWDAEYILLGDRERLLTAAKEQQLSLERFCLVHTPTVLTMEDEAMAVMREKADSSMSLGLHMLAEGKGDALVSTGNTGALFTGANLIVRKIKGVRRPAIAAMLPMHPPVLLLDSGANVEVTADYLEQFAVMGTQYMRHVFDIDCPRVGLLNNGSEEKKGTDLQREAYGRLKNNPDLCFVGNVEGNCVMNNVCDVLVTDGFTGNILLKTMEGMGKLMLKTLKELFSANAKTAVAYGLVRSDLRTVKKNFDASELGGAPILGISRPVIKAHGSSDAKAFKNAIGQALTFSEADVTEHMTEAMRRLSEYRQRTKDADGADEAQQ